MWQFRDVSILENNKMTRAIHTWEVHFQYAYRAYTDVAQHRLMTCQSLHAFANLNPRPDHTVLAQNQSFFKGPTSLPTHVLPFVCGSPLAPHGLLNCSSKCCLAPSRDQMMYWLNDIRYGCIVAHTCRMGDNWRIVSCFDRMHACVARRTIFWMFTSRDSKKVVLLFVRCTLIGSAQFGRRRLSKLHTCSSCRIW